MQVYDYLEGEFIETITAGVNPSEKNVPPFNLRIHMDSFQSDTNMDSSQSLSPQLLCYHNSYLPLKPADLMHA